MHTYTNTHTQTWVIFIQLKKFSSLKVSLKIEFSDRIRRLILQDGKIKILAFRLCMTLKKLCFSQDVFCLQMLHTLLDKVRIIIFLHQILLDSESIAYNILKLF